MHTTRPRATPQLTPAIRLRAAIRLYTRVTRLRARTRPGTPNIRPRALIRRSTRTRNRNEIQVRTPLTGRIRRNSNTPSTTRRARASMPV
jgi:hypothetical protein